MMKFKKALGILFLIFTFGFFSQAQNMFFHLLPGFVAPFTWVGLGGDVNWNNSANWSTGVVPGAGNTAIFDDICTANCNPTINVAINVGGVNMKSTYAGTITQGVGNTITIGSAGWTQEAGTFTGAGATVTMNGFFNLSGGIYTATSGTTSFANNFTKSGGTYDHSSGQTIFSTSGTLTIAPGGVQFNNLTFTSSPGTFNLSAGTMTVVGNLVSTGTHGFGAQGSINNGTIEVQGNVTLTGEAHGGTGLIRINGTGAQTLTGVAAGYISSVEVNKASGTLTLVNTIRTLGNWTQTAGTVDAGTSTIQFENHSTITPGNVNYNNITFFGDARTYSLNAGTMIVDGVLTLHSNNGSSAGSINSGTIEAKGNVTIAGQGQIGSALIRISGTGSQTLTGTAAGWIGSVEINKPSDTLTLANTIRSYGNWTWLAGTIDAGTSTIQFEINSTITPGAFNYNNITFTDDGSSRTYSLNAGTLNVGGILTFTTNHPSTPGNVNNGTINAAGNVIFSSFGQSGSAILNFTGNANTTLTIGASAATLSTTHNVAKTGLTTSLSLVANTDYAAAGRNFSVTSGSLNIAGFAFSVNNQISVAVGGRILCNGGTATAGSWTLLGEISCGSGEGITWTGAANDNLWSTAGNWTNNTIPGASDLAIFNNSACVAAQCNAQIDSNLSVRGIVLRNSYTGTLTQNLTRTLTVGSAGYTQAAGTFSGGNSAVIMNGVYVLTGGTYTATSGAWTQVANLTISGAPTFNHNSGSWSTNTAITVSPNSAVFNNVTFTHGNQSLNNQIMYVDGNLLLNASNNSPAAQINSGTLIVRGNLNIGSRGKAGSAIIRFEGNAVQNIDGSSATQPRFPAVEIAKAGGTLNLVGSLNPVGNWTWISGAVDAGTSTVTFSGAQTITPGPGAYNNVTFSGGSGVIQSLNNNTMVVQGTLLIAGTSSTSQLSSGNVEARGDIVLSGDGKRGDAVIKIVGTGAQLLTGGGSTAMLPATEINKPSDTLTLTGTIQAGGNWTWIAGTVDAGTSTLVIAASTQTTVPGPVLYNNVTFTGGSGIQSLNNDTMVVQGTLSLAGTSSTSQLSSGSVEARGAVVVSGNGKIGDAQLFFRGASNANLTWTAGSFLTTNISIEKTGGASVLLQSNALFSTAGRDFTITTGTFDLNGYDFNVNDVLTVGVGGTLKCNGGEIIDPQPVSIVNSGTINCPGYSTYDFNWTGAGGDVNWNTAGNWQGGVAPVATDIVVFQDTYCGANCNATINVAANVRGVRLRSPYTGTITQGSGNSVTIGTRGWNQAAGIFIGGDSTMSSSGQFTMTGGSFTSTSATYNFNTAGAVWNTSAGTFNHNSGTVQMDPSGGTTSINQGTNQFNNLNLFGWAASYSITGTSTVNGHLQFGTGSGSGSGLNAGTLNVLGNLTSVSNGIGLVGAIGIINVSGTGAQVLTGSNGGLPGLTINKPSGSLDIIGAFDLYGILNYVSGVVNPGTSTFNLYSYTHQPNGLTLNHVNFRPRNTNANFNLSNQNLNIAGNMIVDATVANTGINSGTINLTGNLTQTGNQSMAGSVLLNLVGAVDSTVNPSGSLRLPGATVTVNKNPLNKVTLAGNTLFNNAGQNLTVTAGTLDMAGFNLTVANNISNSGTIQRGLNPTCGTISQGGSYSGNATVCP